MGEICRARGIIFHVDSAQATGKLPIDLAQLKVDLMSFSAHKTYGPKGIGALFVRRKPRVRIEAQMHGGGHERGMRSGTLPTHQIVGMGEAFRHRARPRWPPRTSASACCATGCGRASREIDEVYVNGDMEHRVPHNLNASFNFVEGESLIMAIKDIAVSSGSACTSASLEPSYVLRALGRSDELAHSSIRFTIGRFTTEADVDYTIDLLKRKVAKLRELSPALGNAPGWRRPATRSCGRRTEQRGSGNMAYSDKVLDHYENPRNVGSFAKDAHGRRHRHGRRARLRRRDEAADPRRRRTASSRTPSSRPTAAARRSRRRRSSPNG